jgi:segregation and condensation protein A
MSADPLQGDVRSCHIRLDSFEGPLDLLLYLIRRDELDICDVPVAHVAGQYLLYIRASQELNLNIASEYLVMAATLTSIKSRSLLPSHPREGEEEEDPGAELRRQLILYRAFREIARELQRSEETWRDIYTSPGERERWSPSGGDMEPGQASLLDLLRALESLTVEEDQVLVHSVAPREMTITECIEALEKAILPGGRVTFSSVLGVRPTRKHIVSYFVTVLELVRRGWIALRQPFPFAEITLERTGRWTVDS